MPLTWDEVGILEGFPNAFSIKKKIKKTNCWIHPTVRKFFLSYNNWDASRTMSFVQLDFAKHEITRSDLKNKKYQFFFSLQFSAKGEIKCLVDWFS